MFLRIASDICRCRLLLACTVVLAVGGCSVGNNMPSPSFATSEGAGSGRAYKLGVGDELKVTVFGEENLSGTFKINPHGGLEMPLVGEIGAVGQTVSGVRARIVRKLSNGYLKQPRVNVEVANYRPIYVHGEVKSGGEFAYKTGLKFRDAVAMAGGYTYRAEQSYVVVVREGERETRLQIPTNIRVQPGDNIRVPERFF